MTPNEFTQWLNLARALNLVISSRRVGGILYVYTPGGQSKPWDAFAAEYPLERLQAMISREKSCTSPKQSLS